MVIQILFTIISVIAILKALGKLRQRTFTLFTFIIWLVLWGGIVFLVWQPNLTNNIASILQVGRGADAILYLSLVLIFYLFFKVFVRLEYIERKITDLTRATAITETKRKMIQ